MIASLFWPVDATPKPFKDVRIDESVGIDFSAYPRTLMMVLHSECGYCHESVPFYRRVITRAVDLQVVVVASSDDVGIGDYLDAAGLDPHALVFVDRGQLPVPATPTLMLVKADGTATHAWIGLLDAEREEGVLDVLFG